MPDEFDPPPTSHPPDHARVGQEMREGRPNGEEVEEISENSARRSSYAINPPNVVGVPHNTQEKISPAMTSRAR